MKKINLFLFLLLLSGVFITGSSFAGPDQPVKLLLDGALDQLKVDSARTVEDAKFFDAGYNSLLVKPYGVKNKISFRINGSSPFYLQSAFTATVRIRITSTLANSSTTTLDTALTVNYRPDSVYVNESIYAFSDAYRVEVKILQTTTDVGWPVWKALQLENELQSFPVYTFSCTDNAVQSVTHDSLAADTKADELPVSWGNMAAADEYDLEWTYIDSSALASGNYDGASNPDPALLFENNGTRVSITATSYKIPLLYDNKGTLFFRVRSVQYQPGGGRSESAWSSDYLPAGLGSFVFNGHERSLNWQATTSFAEEGKRKSVVQYYDGSLRSRQTVTKDNSRQTTIVGESIYDHQGRPVIQVLPAPTLKTIIGYSRNFNIGLNGNAYDKDNFDTLSDPSNYCVAAAEAMKIDSGAAQYYSANNPEKETGINKFIPDAGSYPFTETQYTPDNTGRISSQGGVGAYHRINSGRETKYYYGTPDQEELDALFGTEVGNRSHYFKNMVRDANGQYSVSYVDMHGRTIATALAGIPTVNMDNMGVDSNAVTVTRKLTDSSNNFVQGTVIQSSKSLLVAVPGLHTFSYSLHPDSLRIAGCDSNLICYDCLYDLTITISDDCNNQKLGGHAFDTVVHNFSLNAIDTTCSNSTPGFSFTFSKYLQEGNYEITKKLTLSRYAQDYYRDSIFLKRNHCKSVETFIEEQRTLLAGALACTPYSDSVSTERNDIRRSMLLDVTPPSGQYANTDTLQQDKYSIFYSAIYDNATPDTLANYTKPAVYLDENGQPDSVYDEVAGKIVSPGQLSPEAFAAKFKSSWAAALLPYHPEYCKLTQIEIISGSYDWDARFAAVETYQEAMSKGYLNPTNNSGAPYNKYNATGTADPDSLAITYSNGTNNYKTKLEAHLLEYRDNNIGGSSGISLWGLATSVAMCGSTSNAGSCLSHYGNNDSAFSASNMCTGDLDMAWRSFRQMYLDVKREIIQAQVTTTCTGQPGSIAAATLLAANHQPNFGDAVEMLNAKGLSYATTTADTTNTKQQVKQGISDYYDANCRAYAEQWWHQLKPCSYSSVDSAIIIPRLIQVCKEGSDIDHTLGSSTVKPSSTYQYRSFEQVLKEYNSSTYNANCNAYLITAPKPYDQQKALGNIDVWQKPDSCQCAVINKWYTKYQSSGDASFSAYLSRVANTSISNAKLDSLRQLCNGQITCQFLASPLVLPRVLQCGVKDVCVSCERFDLLNTDFKNEFPEITLIENPNSFDSAQLSRNQLYTNFMNYKLGFTQTFSAYMEFKRTCHSDQESWSHCDSLTNLLDEFNTAYKYPSVNTPGGVYAGDSTDWAVDNDLAEPVYWKDCVKDGILTLPKELNVPSGDGVQFIYNRPFTIPKDGLFIESRVKCDVDTSVCNYPNFQFKVVRANGTFNILSATEATNCFPDGGGWFLIDSTGTTSGNTQALKFDLSQWTKYKIGVLSNKYLVFINDSLVLEKSYVGNVNITAISLFFGLTTPETYVPFPYVDYLRAYDACGNLLFNNDFNSVSDLGVPDLSIRVAPYDYKTLFKNFYNTRKTSSYTYEQIDSIYFSNCGTHISSCNNNNSTDSSNLQSILKQYQQTYVQPASGFVDLDMRTFAGNKTPAEGPKGVFNVNGQLIGNTIDSTEQLVRESYAQVWNSDSANQVVGSLSALDNGKFRLVLNPGQIAPCDGIVGMRYYQYDAPVDSIFSLKTGIGTFIDFGDSLRLKADSLNSNSTTRIVESNSVSNTIFLGIREIIPDGTSLTYYAISHKYTSSASHTISIYHPDIKGVMDFTDNKAINSPNSLRNLRGYMPQQTLLFAFNGVKDSSMLSTYKLRNFSQVNSIEYLKVYVDTFFNSTNHLQSFTNNNKLKYIQFVLQNNNYSTNNPAETPLSRFAPNLNVNFPDLRFLQVTGVNSDNFDSVNFALPKLRCLDLSYLSLSSAQYDRFYNQLGSVNNEQGGRIYYFAIGGPRTSVSDAAFNQLHSQDWLEATFSSLTKILDTVHLPVATAFSDFFNERLGTNYNYSQIDSIYNDHSVTLTTCPSYCDTCYNSLSGPLLCGKSDPIFPSVTLDAIDNCSDSSFFAISKGMELFDVYRDSLNNYFDSAYRAKCLQAYKYESFTVTKPNIEYHYTLYYYDQAGNLVKTVPPKGVDTSKFAWSAVWSDSVRLAAKNRESLKPSHTLITQYRYNTLNQVIAQQTPDAGKSQFWYDRLGRLAVSQNAKQKAASATEENRLYSYTLYDSLGRITEVGEIKNTGSDAITDSISRVPSYLNSWLTASAAGKSQITQTVYDIPYAGFTGITPVPLTQANLRNRVSYTSITQGANPAQYNQATFYSYDIHGNVDTLLQDYGSNSFTPVQNIMNGNNNRFKKIIYKYDLISGKVNHVAYQPNQLDQLYHRYSYDAENRLTDVETSIDSILWEKDARYEYYKHGPLGRVVLGDQLVQGIDYAYTLQGWLKGVNSNALTPNYDMGRDGDTSHANRYIAKDAIGFSLNYFAGDYTSINTTVLPFPGYSAYLNEHYKPLYNGNIGSMAVNIGKFQEPLLYNYRYDRLNRITEMDTWKGYNAGSNSWSGLFITSDYKERVSYDPNGNILKYLRNTAGTTSAMDSMSYKYYAGTNRLSHIRDNAGAGIESNDIEDQFSENYGYDEIGNLIKDSSEHIGVGGIKWNVYGKITEINRTSTTPGSNAKRIQYWYDAVGNRIGKKVSFFDSSIVSYTWYVRDAGGNVMSVYSSKKDTSSLPSLSDYDLSLNEQHIYGSTRLGMQTRKQDVEGSYTPGHIFNHFTGARIYELSNHLGNVLATISDRKLGVALSSDSSLIFNYVADVQTAQDYYPFGMIMPGRNGYKTRAGWSSGSSGSGLPDLLSVDSRVGNQPPEYKARQEVRFMDGFTSGGSGDQFDAYVSSDGGGSGESDGVAGSGYRYGFNGKEQDDDVKGVGNQQDYGMRIYDPRIAKFLSVDPLTRSYPMLTPYQFASNRPIDGIDRDGLEYLKYIPKFNYTGSGIDYVAAIDNGVIDVLNLVPSLWNSGITTVKSINRGSYGEDLKSDFRQMGSGIKEAAGKVWKDPLKTLTSPEALEFIVSSYVGGKILPSAGGSKGNLLTLETNITRAAVSELNITTTNSLFGGNSIKLVQGRTTTAIGRYANGIEHIKATGQFKMGVNNGGVNILNLKTWTWEANVEWLQAAIKRNDAIRVVSDPRKLENIWEKGVKGTQRTTFGKEVKMLENAGYKFDGKNQFIKSEK